MNSSRSMSDGRFYMSSLIATAGPVWGPTALGNSRDPITTTRVAYSPLGTLAPWTATPPDPAHLVNLRA